MRTNLILLIYCFYCDKKNPCHLGKQGFSLNKVSDYAETFSVAGIKTASIA